MEQVYVDVLVRKGRFEKKERRKGEMQKVNKKKTTTKDEQREDEERQEGSCHQVNPRHTRHSHSNNFSVRLSQLHRLSQHYPKALLTTCSGSKHCLLLRND